MQNKKNRSVTMKKFILPVMLVSAMTTFSACGSTSGSTNANTGSLLGNAIAGAISNNASSSAASTVSGIGNILGQLLNSSSSLTQNDLIGTWKYQSPDCVFESENLLAKAGGAVASEKIEQKLASQLSSVGIKSGACSFTFNKDNTYNAVIGGKSITGNYTLDAKNKTIKMTYLGGLGSMTPRIVKNGSSISLLYESDKLLKLVSTVSKLSGSSSIKTLSSLLGNYDGMYIGMKLKK